MSVKVRLDLDVHDLVDNINHAMADGLREGLEIVEGAAKEKCPVGPTGFLRGTIYTNVEEGKDTIVGSCAAPMEYAVYVHEGTHKMSARPFLYNALVEQTEQIEQAIYRKVVGAIS